MAILRNESAETHVTAQELLGYNDVKTIPIYIHVMGQHSSGISSPIDKMRIKKYIVKNLEIMSAMRTV